MIDIEAIKDAAVSVFPEGVPADALPDLVELVVRLVEIEQMKWTLQNGRWVGPRGQVDERPTNGCREIAEAGTLLVATGSARPKPGDLKPSESLLRDLNATAQAPAIAMREQYRARLAELDREIAAGKTEVHPEATPGNAVSVPGENGRRMIVPESRLTPADRQALAVEEAARTFVPPPPVRKVGDVGAGSDGMTADERLRVSKARAEIAATPPVARLIDAVPQGAVIIPAKPDYRAPSRADVESWEPSAMKCIPKGS